MTRRMPLALLLMSLLLLGSAPTFSQGSTRSFQMLVWTDDSSNPKDDSDVAVFWGTHGQPPGGRTIWVGLDYNTPALTPENFPGINWSTLIAVEFDEPYKTIDSGIDHGSCQDVTAAASAINDTLMQQEKRLKSLAPKARFWVNLSKKDIDWVHNGGCLSAFNQSYVDVLSFDEYDQQWSGILDRFNDLTANPVKSDQQFALIPGVFSSPYPGMSLSLLPNYFDLANSKNQTCNLPPSSQGATGIFDGCLVWGVMGFLGPTEVSYGTTYVGLMDSSSASIKAAWEMELMLPLTPGLAHQSSPAQIIQPALQLLLRK